MELQVGDGLREGPPGFWTAAAEAVVSYPDQGHGFTHDVAPNSFWFRHRTACIQAALHRHPPGGTMLDVGGGTGHVALALRREGHDVVLVEPGPAGARTAYDQGLRPVINATTVTAGLPPASVPAVGLFDVIEHVQDDRAFMAHVAELVVRGGRTYITVPAHEWLWSVDDVRAGHHRRYTASALRDVLVASGWEVEFLSPFFRWLPLPILLVRSIPSRLGLREVDDQAAAARDHVPSPWLGSLVERLLAPEVARIRGGRPMRVGASLLAVARRQ